VLKSAERWGARNVVIIKTKVQFKMGVERERMVAVTDVMQWQVEIL